MAGEVTICCRARSGSRRINQAWDEAQREMMDSILKVGRELVKWHAYIKENGERVEWIQLYETDELKMTRMTAFRLMCIANDKRIVTHVLRMPPQCGTLYQITRLDDPTFKRLLKDGTICPSLERNEITSILRKQRVTEDEKRILD